jgi:DNA-binding NarL/FixJ family response regulator
MRESRYSRKLTNRELWVLEQMMAGANFIQISTSLGLPRSLVRLTAHRIYDKLGADNRVQAVMFAYDMGTLTQFSFWGS